MMTWMDDFEGHPEIYQRDKIRIVTADNSGKNIVECWVYFLKKFPPGLLNYTALRSFCTTEDREKYPTINRHQFRAKIIFEMLQKESEHHLGKKTVNTEP
ncbi:hypothetical protein LSH36_141g08075 [Paralvinella palmiformis]|uniref:Gamma-glutamylcyclotransferase AIG2-like domain-containing protein n=1 Tax=Paralvinella palmiformis TaxID=53620 RepID=A0AAD9JVI7_9ANNE|nr:hypothetical protein LSH36_141g08075 [Paralvinella palmiformis]